MGELVSGDATQTPFLFNGLYGVMTDDNGLYYMRARFYSPEIKRFVNQDILLGNIVEGQTLNRFAFVTGNPVSFVDPFGLFADYIWDIPVIGYDIYYGITTGNWTPLGIDLPLAVAPSIPSGTGMFACGFKLSKIPFGFKHMDDFLDFSKNLHDGLKNAGLGDTTAIFQGSSVTGKSFKSGQPFDSGVSDFEQEMIFLNELKPSVSHYVQKGRGLGLCELQI